MRCFYVRVHGLLEWESDYLEGEENFTPAGFYCHRYVLASGYQEAAEKAFRRVRKNLEKQTGWTGRGLAKLTLDAEELVPAPMHKLLRRDDKGHVFYESDVAAPARAE